MVVSNPASIKKVSVKKGGLSAETFSDLFFFLSQYCKRYLSTSSLRYYEDVKRCKNHPWPRNIPLAVRKRKSLK